MTIPVYGGFIAVFGSIVFFGSNPIPYKFPFVLKYKLHPIFIQLGMIIPIFTLPWLLLLYNKFQFTLNIMYGIYGACFWVPANVCAIFAIKYLGIGIAQGLWSGITIVVSFLWGVLYFGDRCANLGLTLLGMLCLILGVIGISLSDVEFKCRRGYSEINNKENVGGFRWRNLVIGVLFVLVLGVLNGTMMIPVRMNKEGSSIVYLVSFGIGVAAITPIIFIIFVLFLCNKINNWRQQFIYSIPVGCIVGLFWELGNFCATYAVLSPLGLTIGFPLTQCALVVAAFFGMVIFKELNSMRKKIMYFVSTFVLLLPGIFLLSYFGIVS